jgi:K+-transporting ATPase ATPase A chain
VITTSASCGAVNAMHDSFTPLGGAVPLVLIQLGEVVFGGVGAGLYGMLVFAILTGLHRRPDDRPHPGVPWQEDRDLRHEDDRDRDPRHADPRARGHRHRRRCADAGRAGIANPGAHGLSEILYAFSSAGNNNGSAFAGLSANTPFYNTVLAVAMWFGRFGVIVPCSPSPVRSRRRSACRSRPAPCRRTARCSSSS